MAVTTFDYGRFEVYTMPAKEWWGHYRRTELKYHDPDGVFGAEKYDYFLYRSTGEIEIRGSSKPYILIHTQKSLENMRPEIKERVRRVMIEKHDIDINEVIDLNLVIVACDRRSGSAVGENNASIFFQRKESAV